MRERSATRRTTRESEKKKSTHTRAHTRAQRKKKKKKKNLLLPLRRNKEYALFLFFLFFSNARRLSDFSRIAMNRLTATEKIVECESRIPLELLAWPDAVEERTLSTSLREIFGATGDVFAKMSMAENEAVRVAGEIKERNCKKKGGSSLFRRFVRARRQNVDARFPLKELSFRSDDAYRRVLYELGYHSTEEQADVAWPQSDEWRWRLAASTESDRIEPWRVYLCAKRMKRHVYSVTCPFVSVAAAARADEQRKTPTEKEEKKQEDEEKMEQEENRDDDGDEDEDDDRQLQAQRAIDRWWRKTHALSYVKVAVADLFPFLRPGSVFSGHPAAQRHVKSAHETQRAFAELFSGSSRVYATTLLRLPFWELEEKEERVVLERRHAVDDAKSTKSTDAFRLDRSSKRWRRRLVDFRGADPKVLADAISGERTARDPDSYFYALIVCRAELGVDEKGAHIFLPLLPAPPETPYAELHLKETDLLRPMEDDSSVVLAHEPSEGSFVAGYELQFCKLRDDGRRHRDEQIAVADFATLNFWTRPGKMQPHKVAGLMSRVFPVAYRQSMDRIDLLRKVYAWRMKWRYAASRLVYCRGSDGNGRLTVTARTLRPWF